MVTYAIMLACLIVHTAMFVLSRTDKAVAEQMFNVLALDPAPDKLRWYGFFSYQFVHADWMHLAGNMLFLWVFGPAVEDRFRRIGFLLFYLLGGAFAGFAHMVLESGAAPADAGSMGQSLGASLAAAPPVVGASGAIACVTGAYLVLFPLATVRVLWFFGFFGVYHFPAWIFIVFAVFKDLWGSAWNALGAAGENIAFGAHLGGYAFGAMVAFVLLAFKVIPREPYDLFSIGKHAHRRRQFKELATSGRSPWLNDAGKAVQVAPESRKGTPKTSPAEVERQAAARSAVVRALAEGRGDEACRGYESLLAENPRAILPREQQLEVGNYLTACGKHSSAAAAYELFIERYPGDRQAVEVKLMLAVICARYLNDPVRAKTMVEQVRNSRPDAAHQRVADELAKELG